MDLFNTFLSIIYCDSRHGPCWDITGQKRMTNVYSGMILKSWESHLDGDGLKSGQEMMRLFFSFQIWIVYEMLLHQTFLLFNLAELSSFPWLFFKGLGSDCISRAHQTPALANMVLDLVENHPHHQPWYHHCDCASDLIRSTEFMRAVWCEYAILPRISCNLCIYAAAIQNDEHGDQIKIIFFFF